MAVDVSDFGLCNFKLARQVMESRKCACKPKEPCPCPEWITDGKCHCGVFWDREGGFGFTKSQIKIAEDIIVWLNQKIEQSVLEKKPKDSVKKQNKSKPNVVRLVMPKDLRATKLCPRMGVEVDNFPYCFEGTGEPDCEKCTKG